METNNINIGNFFQASLGIWTQIQIVPKEFNKFYCTADSTYYKNDEETIIVRISDHWGSGIRECNWYLGGYPRNNSFYFKKNNNGQFKIGKIEISQLKDLRI